MFGEFGTRSCRVILVTEHLTNWFGRWRFHHIKSVQTPASGQCCSKDAVYFCGYRKAQYLVLPTSFMRLCQDFQDSCWLEITVSLQPLWVLRFVPRPTLHMKRHCKQLQVDGHKEVPSLSALILWVRLTRTSTGPHPWGDTDNQGIQLTYWITRSDGRPERRVEKAGEMPGETSA